MRVRVAEVDSVAVRALFGSRPEIVVVSHERRGLQEDESRAVPTADARWEGRPFFYRHVVRHAVRVMEHAIHARFGRRFAGLKSISFHGSGQSFRLYF